MSFANAHTNIIDRSQFYEFHGDYKHSEFHGDYNHKEAKPGEHGMHPFALCYQNLLITDRYR